MIYWIGAKDLIMMHMLKIGMLHQHPLSL